MRIQRGAQGKPGMMGKGMSQVPWQEKRTGRSVRVKGHGGERSDGVSDAGWREVGWGTFHGTTEAERGGSGTKGTWGCKGRRGKQKFPDVH